uniref:GIY-YIG/LAGLIDADG n=1 Tax=Ophiocordyceps sinensis TaxID=72228 RepID=A0A1X8VJK8_9HYPO|nr:GIY-YIG/LAGLIDADG [Ophiocordyceps sinensis]ARF03384.1 GIY-YIG/LAGLIDADG [Ophiocordyceps sinensis]
MEGLKKILSIKASMNRGLPEKLIKEFTNIIPTTRPELKYHLIPDPCWIAGFASGEGCLMVRVRDSYTSLTGSKVELIFQITQHTRDKILIISLINYLGCGKYRERKGGLAGDYLVYKLSDITDKIIPFFDKYPILGVKSLEYNDFKLVSNVMKNKGHLTIEGLNQIKQIQSGMNTNRSIEVPTTIS